MKPLTEIRQLYYETTKATVERDLRRAVTLLKSMASEADREKAAVYMDGLSQMRSEWAAEKKKRKKAGSGARRKTR